MDGSQSRRRRQFHDPDPPPLPLTCQHEGCAAPGLYRAPRSPQSLNDYLWFCLDHVRDYNRRWNYYADMSPAEMESAIRAAIIGERPTWPLGHRVGRWRLAEGDFIPAEQREAMARRLHGDKTRARDRWKARTRSPEEQALAILDLAPPVTWAEIKKRYKALAKALHPDANGGDRRAEEKLKIVNQAYSRLKLAALG